MEESAVPEEEGNKEMEVSGRGGEVGGRKNKTKCGVGRCGECVSGVGTC